VKTTASSSRWRALILTGVAALVLVAYALAAHSGMLENLSSSRGETYYNLLVRGIAYGRLSLARGVPAGLAHLPDPFDPVANAPYRLVPNGLHDLSYYGGKLYLYFGPTPALVLFGPWALLTRHYLYHREAALIFCFAGFLLGFGLLRAIQRRYFPGGRLATLALGGLLLGLGTGWPILLARAEVYEVAISCGYCFTVATWVAVWCAWHRPAERGRWLVAASMAYGLALGARPSLLGGALILLLPVFWTGERPRLAPLARNLVCALGPVALIGCALLLYNQLRFGQPLEFGQHYQLASDRQDAAKHFSPAYLGFNLRVYLWQPVRWHGHFPFVHRSSVPSLPAGHVPVEDPFGALLALPVLLLALAAPWAWRHRRPETADLRRFLAAVAWSGGAAFLTLGLFYGSCSRYEEEFLPALGLLAAVGWLAGERALAGRPLGLALLRWGGSLLLAVSVLFGGLEAVEHYAEAGSDAGLALIQTGRLSGGIDLLRRVARLDPELVGIHVNLGSALARSHRLREATAEFATATRLDPASFEAQISLAQALEETGHVPEAIGHYQAAVRLKPERLEPHYRLGNALGNAGQLEAAIRQYAEVLQIQPTYVPARANLGLALAEAGRPAEAIAQLDQALRDQPGNAEAEAYLGFALAQAGRWAEAVDCYERVLLRHPDNKDIRFQLEAARRHLAP